MSRLFVVSGMGWIFAPLLLVFTAAHGSMAPIDAFVFGSLGEAPYRQISDVVGSTVVPQAGLQAGWFMEYGGPFVEASVGRYNAGGLYEGSLGLMAGADVWKVRPGDAFPLRPPERPLARHLFDFGFARGSVSASPTPALPDAQ